MHWSVAEGYKHAYGPLLFRKEFSYLLWWYFCTHSLYQLIWALSCFSFILVLYYMYFCYLQHLCEKLFVFRHFHEVYNTLLKGKANKLFQTWYGNYLRTWNAVKPNIPSIHPFKDTDIDSTHQYRSALARRTWDWPITNLLELDYLCLGGLQWCSHSAMVTEFEASGIEGTNISLLFFLRN